MPLHYIHDPPAPLLGRGMRAKNKSADLGGEAPLPQESGRKRASKAAYNTSHNWKGGNISRLGAVVGGGSIGSSLCSYCWSNVPTLPLPWSMAEILEMQMFCLFTKSQCQKVSNPSMQCKHHISSLTGKNNFAVNPLSYTLTVREAEQV